MGQWLQRGIDRVKVAKQVWFPAHRKSNRVRRNHSVRGRFREVQICDSDESCADEQNSQEDEYLDIFTTEDEYGTIKRFSHRMPLGLRGQPMTPESECDDSPSPVSLTKYFAVEKSGMSPPPNHAVLRFDTEDSLGFGNFTQTKFDETVEGLSLHTPPSSSRNDLHPSEKREHKRLMKKLPNDNFSSENACEVIVPTCNRIPLQRRRKRKTYAKPKTSEKYKTRENAYFDQLIRALSRKYWKNNATNEGKMKRNKCRGSGDTADEDTTFTNVTDLTKRDFSTNNESLKLKSVPLCSSVNRMQVITEETLPGDATTDIDLYEGEKASENQSSSESPNSIRFYQEDNYDNRSQESQESENDEDAFDYAKGSDLNNVNENNNNECLKCRNVANGGVRRNGATIVKLNMPIDHILSRIRRPGLKVYCYRFWIEANLTNWNAFHTCKDRRIESIGRATTCHIRLKVQAVRQASGFLKQEVVVYAPTMLALEKCCNLFDQKFPRFYASNDFRKMKHIFSTNT